MSILSTALFEQYSLLLLQQIANNPAGVDVQSNMSTAVYRQNTLILLQYIATHGGGGGGGTGATGATGARGATGVAGTVGATGATGTGTAGAVGATGATGAGTAGATGATGPSISLPVSIANGGTAATNATDALANLGNIIFPVSVRQSGNLAPASQTATTLTYAVGVGIGGTAAVDGYTLVQGDVVLFISQTPQHQNGPWVITTLGTASVAAVLTRPSWFTTGTAKSGTLCLVQYGTAGTGYVMSISGPTNTTGAAIALGTSAIAIAQIWGRVNLATTGTNLFTAYQSFRANGAGANAAPFFFQAGAALMTAPQANAVEWFNDQIYLTNAAGVRTTNTNHVAIPATATSAGQVGQIAVDNAGGWLYVCTATNVWKRVSLATF